MKKFLSFILAILIVFTLSGCSEEDPTTEERCAEDGYSYAEATDACYYVMVITDRDYYPREEVDAMLEEFSRDEENRYLEYFVFYEESNGLLYAQCQDASGYEECYVELDYRPLEEDITTLEDEIAIATIAMLDILIYQYENTIDNPTEADIAMYNLLLMQRLELEGEIE